MYVKLKKGEQKKLVITAIAKAGSERKLCVKIEVPKGSLYKYKNEITNIPCDRFNKILQYLGDRNNKSKSYIIEILPKNWGRQKGGINCILKKKSRGIFEETIRRLNENSSKWHKKMKLIDPIKYHRSQFEKFMKVGRGYNYALNNGIKVRNKLEQYIGNYLIKLGLEFEYEPLLKIKEKVYFPDFRIKDKIIEVTGWQHPSKERLLYLSSKIHNYNANRCKIILFVPLKIRKFYKAMDCPLISTLPKLKEHIMPP
jgi:hypothetical protein